MDVRHHFVSTNGIRMHVAEAGEGPVVLLCHGFPQTWRTWRHQLAPLAAAGFRVVAPDMRGYGQTERPENVDQYTMLHLVGDMVGLLDALGVATAVIVGQDYGSVVAWYAALLRPDRFDRVVGLSHGFQPRAPARPTTLMPQNDAALFYQLYFQTPGVAEAELSRDPRATIRHSLCTISGEAPPVAAPGMVPRGGGMLSVGVLPESLPGWLTQEDIDAYAAEFERTGFAGALNWFRNADRNWELLAPFAGAKIMVPALYIVGARDLVLARGVEQVLASVKSVVPQLVDAVVLPGCGHWTHEERPTEVTEHISSFLAKTAKSART